MAEKKPKRIFLKILIFFFYVALFLCIFVICAGITVINMCGKDLPDVEMLAKFEPSETSIIYSSDGQVIAKLFKENRYWVPLDEIPKSMKDAIISIEDSRFYTHHGVDPKSIMRALVADFKGRSASQGASTITMQLAREIFLHPQKSIQRKIQEIIIAIQIERRFTKNEILEYYLNQIYFGSGAYGIEAAAQIYFSKHAKDLTLAESALIAGLPPAPTVYSPFVDEESALIRQGMVLNRMVECGFINKQEADEALDYKLIYAEHKSELQQIRCPYFTSYVLKQLSQKYSDDLLYRGGLKIYTTLDMSMQSAAEKSLKDGLRRAANESMNATNGAIVAIDPRNGYIRAMVGGVEYTEKNQFNRAWQAKRQPGSAFKTMIYTAAIDTGYSPDTIIADSPVTYRMGDGIPWSPQNSDRTFKGNLSIRENLKWSRNVPAVKLMDRVGVDTVIDYSARMGINEPLEPHLSLALGSGVVTPLEMAAAYAVLASGGQRYQPTAIKMIKDSSGNIIEDHSYPMPQEAIAESTAFTMTEMLRGVIEGGTGYSANIGRPAAGKTGTTDEFRDAWFVGYTPQLSCAVWTGNDNNSQMNHVYGGDLPAPIWADFMKKALAKEKKLEFGADSKGIINVALCAETELRAVGSCPNIIKRGYKPGSVPQRFCYKHGPVKYNRKSGKIERVEAEEIKPDTSKKEQPRRSESDPRPLDVEPMPETTPSTFERPKAIPIPKMNDATPREAINIPKPSGDRVAPIDIPTVDSPSGGNSGEVIDDGTSPQHNDM